MKQPHRRMAGYAITSALPPLQSLSTTTPSHQLPAWELEFVSGSRPFLCVVRATKVQAAEAEGRLELAYKCPDFDGIDARLVAARQVL